MATCLVLSHAATAQHGPRADDQKPKCLWPLAPCSLEPPNRTSGSLMGKRGSPTSTGMWGYRSH